MKRQILFGVAALCATLLPAHDFTTTATDGQPLYFNILDASARTAELTYQGNYDAGAKSTYAGNLVVPSRVKNKKVTYSITAVGDQAFRNAVRLTAVTLPSGLNRIGDFAFEGCTSLQRIVFPGNEVKFGQGAFFRCRAIAQVTLGSDWTKVNLKMFRWSSQLKALTVPAKMAQVQNLKSLKGLERISVEANNTHFASVDGVLYSRDCTTLLGCPRAYSGTLRVADSTRVIRWGALVDCPALTEVVLPAALRVLSFREFSRMAHLSRIVMQGMQPITTATAGGHEVTLLTVASPQVKLCVPKRAEEAYGKALVSTAGNYTEIAAHLPAGMAAEYGQLPYEVRTGTALTADHIEGVKDMSKLTQKKEKK